MIDQETLETFNKLYYDTYDCVLRYIVCNCSNIEDAKDIIQNVYLEVIKKIKKNKKYDITSAYILGIAKHKIADFYRFNYKSKIISLFSKKDEIPLLDKIPSNYDLQADFIKKEDLNIVWEYLKSKRSVIFKIFFLYYYDNFSINNISEYLNISESNVKNYLYRTLKELKDILKDRGDSNV